MQTQTFEKLPETKQMAILDASARVFAEKGYFQAGIAEICAATEISNGALYKYFENKKGLFIAVAQRAMRLLWNEASAIAEMEIGFWDKLNLIFGQVQPFVQKYRDYFIVYMDLGSPFMGEFAEELSDSFEGMSSDFFSRIIQEARNSVEVREGFSTESAAYFLDNHLMLFTFSFVSEHYNRRFHQYFGKGKERLSDTEKIDLIMRSFRELLG